MLRYQSPVYRRRIQAAAFVFAGGISLAACGGGEATPAAETVTVPAPTAPAPSTTVDADVLNCQNNTFVTGSNGERLYCAEMQASSADVFRDLNDLFNSKYPQ